MSTQTESPEFDAKAFLKTLTSRPGVYRMLNAEGEVIYVGKARNLAKRVGSYFSRSVTSPKTHAMVSQIANIDVTVTRTENEALLLENNLIKELRPRYNVLLRDDKSYPYIYLSADAFARLAFHRGSRRAGFGAGRPIYPLCYSPIRWSTKSRSHSTWAFWILPHLNYAGTIATRRSFSTGGYPPRSILASFPSPSTVEDTGSMVRVKPWKLPSKCGVSRMTALFYNCSKSIASATAC